jgi:hypothetical protein
MKTHVLINLYNDYSTLMMALHSVKHVVDDIIVADGAYRLYFKEFKKHFKEAKPWSTDGSLDILESMKPHLPPIKLIECPDGKPWMNQCVKRSALLDAVPEGDWFIVLDADEMLYGDAEYGLNIIQSSGCIAGVTPLYNPGLDASAMTPYWHPRVFLKLEGMHYARKHWLLQDEQKRVIEVCYPVKWTDEMVLVHLKIFRGKGRLMPHFGYMHMMSLDGWMEPELNKPTQFFNIPG